VEYRERYSAVGRMPSRPDRRERQGSDREVLAARLIDRALRPLLPPGFLYETQVRACWLVGASTHPGELNIGQPSLCWLLGLSSSTHQLLLLARWCVCMGDAGVVPGAVR
jgi:hypothetical protein